MPRRKAFRFNPLWWLDADTRAIEAFSAISALAFAVILLLPGNIFEAKSGYRVMAALLPDERGWAVIFLLQWMLQSLAMCGNVWVLRYPSAALGCLLWLFVGLCFWLVSAEALAPYIFWLIALFMAWVCLKGPTDGST